MDGHNFFQAMVKYKREEPGQWTEISRGDYDELVKKDRKAWGWPGY